MTARREVDVLRMFAHLDTVGSEGTTGLAHLDLGNGDVMTVKAGGPGVRSWPLAGPFEAYEVLMDNDPPRFWQRYSDAVGIQFANVPKLLVTHHILRSGGIRDITLETQHRSVIEAMSVHLMIPKGSAGDVLSAIASLDGVSLVGSHQKTPNDLQIGV